MTESLDVNFEITLLEFCPFFRSYTLLVKLSWQTPDLNKSTLCCLGSLMLSGWAFGEEVPIGARE